MQFNGEPNLKIALVAGIYSDFNTRMEKWYEDHPNAQVLETVFTTSDRAAASQHVHYGVYITYKE